MAAATAEPAADAAAVSPRSQWRGPPKPHERAAAARRGRPASATQQEVLDTGMEQGQAPLQAKPMSLKERIAANAALRASNEQPVGTANPEKQAPTEKQLDNGVERGAEWEMALALGNDSMEPEQLEALPTAGTEKACMVQVLPQPKLTEGRSSGGAESKGKEAADAAEQISRTFHFPESAEFLSLLPDGSIQVKPPPPELLAAVSKLPLGALSPGKGHQSEHARPNSHSSNPTAWLTELQDILCSGLGLGEQQGQLSPQQAGPSSREGQEIAACSALTAEQHAAAPARETGTDASKQMKQARDDSKRGGGALEQPGQQKKRQRKDVGARNRPEAPSVKSAEKAQAATASRRPEKSLKEKMQLASKAQQERPPIIQAPTAATATECAAAAEPGRKAGPAEGAEQPRAVAGGACEASISDGPSAARPAGDVAVAKAAVNASPQWLSQQPLLQRLQQRLAGEEPSHGPADSPHPGGAWPPDTAAAAPTGRDARDGNALPPLQLPLVERIAVKMMPHARDSSAGGQGRAPELASNIAQVGSAELERTEIPDSEAEADAVVAVLSQVPLASRLPHARQRKAPSSGGPSGAMAAERQAQFRPHIEPDDEELLADLPLLKRITGNRHRPHSCDDRGMAAQLERAAEADQGNCVDIPLGSCRSIEPAHQCRGAAQTAEPAAGPQHRSNAPEHRSELARPKQATAAQPKLSSSERTCSDGADGNWDLLDDFGNLGGFGPLEEDPPPTAGPPETPCAAAGAAPAGASMLADPPSSSALGGGGGWRGPGLRRNVLWSPEDDDFTPVRSAADRRTLPTSVVDPSDSTGCFRRPAARRKRSLVDSCTPGEEETGEQRQLKRLSKHREALPAAVSCGGAAVATPAPAKKSGKAAKRRARQLAAAFIDGEAEVSDDEEHSSDEDGEDSDAVSDLIDDATQPLSSSVQPRRQSEMMAVYRDSLWLHTPTPLKARLAHHACSRGGRTPLQPLSENRSPAAGSRWADSPYDLSDSFIATEGDASQHGQTQHEEVCGVCRCDGRLLCCDGCPAAFHLSCLGLRSTPPGDWFCAVCRDG